MSAGRSAETLVPLPVLQGLPRRPAGQVPDLRPPARQGDPQGLPVAARRVERRGTGEKAQSGPWATSTGEGAGQGGPARPVCSPPLSLGPWLCPPTPRPHKLTNSCRDQGDPMDDTFRRLLARGAVPVAVQASFSHPGQGTEKHTAPRNPRQLLPTECPRHVEALGD